MPILFLVLCSVQLVTTAAVFPIQVTTTTRQRQWIAATGELKMRVGRRQEKRDGGTVQNRQQQGSQRLISECLDYFFFAFFDTIVCFIVYTGCNLYNTLQGDCVGLR